MQLPSLKIGSEGGTFLEAELLPLLHGWDRDSPNPPPGKGRGQEESRDLVNSALRSEAQLGLFSPTPTPRHNHLAQEEEPWGEEQCRGEPGNEISWDKMAEPGSLL